MRGFLLSILKLYVAVMLTLLASDYVLAQRRLTQFQRIADCCSSAAEQYSVYTRIARTAEQLSYKAEQKSLTYPERYLALKAWEEAVSSPLRDSPSSAWDVPGRNAQERVTSFLRMKQSSVAQVRALTLLYQESGPDVEPSVPRDLGRLETHLLDNLDYLAVLSSVTQSQLRDLLSKEAGGTVDLDDYVARSDTGGVSWSNICAPVQSADGVPGTAAPPARSGFLECVQAAMSSK